MKYFTIPSSLNHRLLLYDIDSCVTVTMSYNSLLHCPTPMHQILHFAKIDVWNIRFDLAADKLLAHFWLYGPSQDSASNWFCKQAILCVSYYSVCGFWYNIALINIPLNLQNISILPLCGYEVNQWSFKDDLISLSCHIFNTSLLTF
jgi:hypothetical protein